MSENDRMLREIRRDLYELSQNKEVQISMLEAKFAEADWAAALSESRKEGIRQGKEIGLEQGKEIGLEQGKEIGLEQGKVIGLEQGKEIGLEQGKVIGLEQGEAIGREKGEELRLIRQVCTKLKKQKPMSVIAEELEEDPLYIQRICKAAEKHAPEYDSWDIYTEMNAGQEAE